MVRKAHELHGAAEPQTIVLVVVLVLGRSDAQFEDEDDDEDEYDAITAFLASFVYQAFRGL